MTHDPLLVQRWVISLGKNPVTFWCCSRQSGRIQSVLFPRKRLDCVRNKSRHIYGVGIWGFAQFEAHADNDQDVREETSAASNATTRCITGSWCMFPAARTISFSHYDGYGFILRWCWLHGKSLLNPQHLHQDHLLFKCVSHWSVCACTLQFDLLL